LMVLTPLIKKWMHLDKPMSGEAPRGGH
jgi:hypothetical protein